MSRVGKKPIVIPTGVTIKFDLKKCTIKGAKGQLEYQMPEQIDAAVQDNKIVLTRCGDDRFQRALHGLARALIANMVTGVSKGFKKTLVLEGVGYRAAAKGELLTLTLGFSNPVEYAMPQGVTVVVEKNIITLESNDKQLLGQTAAVIRGFKKVEPYKGKGIRYDNEIVRRKAGKVGTK